MLNEKNVRIDEGCKILMEYHKEYMACCTQNDEKPPLLRKSYSRVQSAKSGVSNVRQSHKRLDEKK